MIMHEYHTYETYSFIADIGGYLVSEITTTNNLHLKALSVPKSTYFTSRVCAWVPVFLHSMILL